MQNSDRFAGPENVASLAARPFIQIPGPNPILVPGSDGSWDDRIIESADVFKDHDTYYLYYHGASGRSGYQLGVATASHPLGPWTKYHGNPVTALGEPGQWDSDNVACGCILKEGTNRYYMWYSGRAPGEGTGVFHIGLATATHPRGPWTKHDGNPIVPGFGYVGGVVKTGDTYRMYNEHPVGETGPDYGPLALATAPAPEGPWTVDPGGPVLEPGKAGAWDDGGFSEAKVTFRNGLYEVFYGGAKLHPTRILSRESIGYAVSRDGRHFVKHRDNPIALRERNPNGAAFAEVHSLFEHPLVYLFHTLRYNSRDGDEDIGVQILATQRPFAVQMPLLERDFLGKGEATGLQDCPPLSCEHVTRLSFSVECRYAAEATTGLALSLRSSTDGLVYDSEDLLRAEIACRPGETVRQTVRVSPPASFARVRLTNLDAGCDVRDLRVVASLGG